MIYKLLLTSVFLAVFVSCSNENKNETQEKKSKEIKEIKDTVKIVEQDSIIVDESIDTKEQPDFSIMSFEEKISALVNIFNEDYKNLGSSKNSEYFLENSNAQKQNVKLKKNTSVNYGDVEGIYPEANLFFYKYKSSEECSSTFAKWLECFGAECDNIKVGTDVRAVKMPPMFIIKNNETIIVLKYLCEHTENNWEEFKDQILAVFKSNESLIADINCGGPLIWLK